MSLTAAIIAVALVYVGILVWLEVEDRKSRKRVFDSWLKAERMNMAYKEKYGHDVPGFYDPPDRGPGGDDF